MVSLRYVKVQCVHRLMSRDPCSIFPQRGSKDEDREVSCPVSLRETVTKANCEVSEIEGQSRASAGDAYKVPTIL
jgi:hypothetical protein